MEFSFIEKQSNNLLPSISVKFPDGYTDRLILWKHYFNEEDRMKNEHTDDCHYFGHLAKEKEACVAVTGCMGDEEILFSIMSAHAPGSTNFVWNKEGDVHIIDPKDMVCKILFHCFLNLDCSRRQFHLFIYFYSMKMI